MVQVECGEHGCVKKNIVMEVLETSTEKGDGMKKGIKFVLRMIGNVIGIALVVFVTTGIFALINRFFGPEIHNIVIFTCLGLSVLILAYSLTRKEKRERIDFSLPHKTYLKMEEAAKEESITISELPKRMIAMYLYIIDERRAGNKLCFVNEDDEIVKEVDFS